MSTAALSGSLFISLASAIGAPTGGIVADRLRQQFIGGRMIVQASGLLIGSAFVFIIGMTNDVITLAVAMSVFGFCKGLYDSNIFASLYDAIEPRARSTAAGLMNMVGWGGGAMGPLAVGYFTKYGGGTQIQNMSKALASGGVIYVISAGLLLLVAFVFIGKDASEVGNVTPPRAFEVIPVASVAKQCPRCQRYTTPQAGFCPQCGSPM
jgi:MFS family permease